MSRKSLVSSKTLVPESQERTTEMRVCPGFLYCKILIFSFDYENKRKERKEIIWSVRPHTKRCTPFK